MSSTEPDRRRRILILIKGLGIGGAERLISGSVPGWDRDRFEYRVAYVLPWKDQLVREIRDAGIEVDCVGSRFGMDPWTLVRLWRLIHRWRPHLIHAHLPSAGILARLIPGIPVVYTEHNITGSYRQPTRALNRLTYGRNDVVAAVSDAVATSLTGYPGPRPVVVPNGVAAPGTDRSAAVRSGLGIGGDTPLIVHVGNIRPHKGHSNLIQAVSQLAGRAREAMVVSIGGEKVEGDLDRVRGEAEQLGVADRIRFLGRRTDATDFLGAADLVVNPSDFEGLPVVILESLSMARPVVATDVGGVSSVVRDGETGLLVPPGDPRALAKAIETALSSDDAGDWGRAGAELVVREHGIDHMIESYETIYEEALDV